MENATLPARKEPFGRPLKFPNVECLEEKIRDFFDLVKNGEEEPSVIGLACHLNVDKQTLLNYQDKPAYRDVVLQAKRQIEKMFTIKAYRGEIPPALFIFTAKNHYDYKEDQNINMNGNLSVMKEVVVDGEKLTFDIGKNTQVIDVEPEIVPDDDVSDLL